VRGTERLRFSESQRRPPTSATHLRRAVTPCVRFVLARKDGLSSRFALPCREVTQTTGSEPRGSLQSPAAVYASPERAASRRLMSRASCLRSEDRVRREARAKGSHEASSPPRYSSRAPELPTGRFDGAGGSQRCDNRPKTLFERRPAKADAIGKVEVLFTESESEHAAKARAPPLLSDRALSHAAHSLA